MAKVKDMVSSVSEDTAETLPVNRNPDHLSVDGADPFAGLPTGMEHVTADDLLIPRLVILQGLSPQVTRGQSSFDENARVGDIYDAGMQQCFSNGVNFLPVYYAKKYLEWAPKTSGKGLQGKHDESILKQCHTDEDGKHVLPNGNYVVETAELYGFNMISEDYWRRSFVPFTSTQLKKARRLMTLAMEMRRTRPDGSQYVPPLFYRTYNLTTVPESNNKGNWMGWKIDIGPLLQELPKWSRIMREAIDFQEAVKHGEAKGDVTGLDGHGQEDPPF